MTLTSYETAVLQALAAAAEPLGWYRIEIALMNVSLPERGHLPTVLRGLRERGYIDEAQSDDVPNERYSITDAGRAALVERQPA